MLFQVGDLLTIVKAESSQLLSDPACSNTPTPPLCDPLYPNHPSSLFKISHGQDVRR